MVNQSPQTNNSNNNTSATTQSTLGQNLQQHNSQLGQQQPQTSSGSSIDAATATVDSQQQTQQQSGGPGRPTSSLGQQQPQLVQQQQQYPPGQQRWPPEVIPPGSSATGPQIPGMMLASPHYPPPPHQYMQQQQHLLGVPSPAPYGYGGAQQPQQHSPNSNRPYPQPPTQMLHPAMMYPPPHGYGPPGVSPYGHPAAAQQYWATRSVNGQIGQQPGMMGPPGTQAAQHYPPPPQQQIGGGQSGSHETPSTSRTPQPQQQMTAPSPSGATNISHEESMEENAGHRPRSSQSQHQQQHHQFATPQGQPQQPPPQQSPHPHLQQQQQIRYNPATMLPPQMLPGQFQPPSMGHHPGMGPPLSSMHPQMQASPHHIGMPPMQIHPHHPAASPFPGHPGMYFAPSLHHPAVAGMHQQPPPPPVGILPGLKPAQREAVEKLIMQLANPKQQMTPEMVYERRLFYERLVLLNEQQGEVLGGPPQVSKSTVDLHALYKAVKQKGGFEKTIRDKIWKNLCTDANIDMQQSSAAGFQLRKHYQKYLLKLECLEQNLNAKDLIEFAEKQKKKKKEKEKEAPAVSTAASTTAATHLSANAGDPATPSSSASTTIAPGTGAGKDDQQQRPQTHPQLLNGPPSQQQPFPGYPPPHGMGLPPGVVYPSSAAGPEFPCPPTSGGYPIPGQQFGQYPPQAQWATTYQQQQQIPPGMYQGQKAPQQMRPPQPYPGQQSGEDEQQQQQYHQQQRLGGSSSRLSAASTPAPATDHPSRASSVAGSAQEKQEPRDEEQRGVDGNAGQTQHQQRQAQTPSSSFSANAPTPPLTTSAMPMPGSVGTAQTPSTAPMPQQQMTPAAGYYHHAGPYGRYPSGQPSEIYAAGPAPGMYGTPQQPPLWGSPYGMPPQSRYHPAPPGAPAGRYSTYAIQQQQQSAALPVASNSPQQQQSATPSQQQQSAGKGGNASIMATPKAGSSAAYPSYGQTPGRVAATGGGPQPAIPGIMQSGPMPPFGSQPIPPPQQFQAWFGSAAMSTQPPPFPPQSLEAQTIGQIQQQQSQPQQRFRRPKIYSRDLYGATPARIVMALRSALHFETCWALNALNIQLYDDTIIPTMQQPSLTQTPELLNLLVEHFAAVLSLLFPRHFNLNTIGWHRCSSSSASPEASSASFQAIKFPKQEPIEPTHKETVTLMVRPPHSSSNNNNNNHSENMLKSAPNFTMISRLGRRVKLDQTEIPPELAAEMNEIKMEKIEEEDDNNNINEEEEEKETFPQFMHRIRRQMIQQIRTSRAIEKLEAFKKRDVEEHLQKEKKDFWKTEDEHSEEEAASTLAQNNASQEQKIKEKENIATDNNDRLLHVGLFYRQPKPWERWDRHGMDECALVSRSTVLQNRHADELMEQLVDRCLALANILRGFSFLPGQERMLAQHSALLYILPVLLMLMVDERSQRKKSGVGGNGNNGPKKFTFPRPPPPEEERSEAGNGQEHGGKMIMSIPSAQQRQTVPPEHDGRKKWLLEVANQLRDDAFTILAHISPNLDLFDMDSAISWPIFDALLHWSVSTDLQARDPLPPYGAISPRHFALEIICKMSVLEKNVDLLVSTGPWPRIEEFVRLLCSLICEEPPVREFAIVILNAICGACEPICYIAAVETELLDHLVAFLEAADANMTQIAQHQGIHTLRENPEIIGTSVGMLRRAALILVHIVKQQNCRHRFHRLQHRLLQFTVSHFMDSRVAAMVADILFEMQRGESGLRHRKGEIAAGNGSDEQQYSKGSTEMLHENKRPEPIIGHGKLSSSAVFQPPAQMEPELMFNGDDGGGGITSTITAENGTGGNEGSSSTSSTNFSAICLTTSMLNPQPPVENNNHHGRKCATGSTAATNSRKRPRKARRSETPDSSTSSSMLAENNNPTTIDSGTNDGEQQQQYCNWNGHSATNHGSDGPFEIKEPIEKKKKSKKASPIGGTVGESVREKMRNNILGKAAANQQQQKKKNGWIGEGAPNNNDTGGLPLQNGIAGDEDHNNGHEHHEPKELTELPPTSTRTTTTPTSSQLNSNSTNAMMTSSSTTTTAMSTQQQTTTTTTSASTNANNNNNSGSLTAVA